jgi:UDPglucose--hexose-1-phosphate uridylyltransferase
METIGLPGARPLFRRTARLSDGREIVLYDEGPASAGDVEMVDRRDLLEASGSSQLRWDALRAEWVTVAAHRQGRTFLPADDDCPLCPTAPGRATEIPVGAFDVAVFENRFPAFSSSADAERLCPGMLASAAGTGRCEVIVFTSEHDRPVCDLPVGRLRTIVEAWIERTAALRGRPDVAYVFVFENSGVEIGVTLTHAHGQIYAYPFVPPFAQRQLEVAERYRADTGRDLLADMLEAERDDGRRIVLATRFWTAYVPFAARWPIEIHLVPHRQVSILPDLTHAERDELAVVYRDIVRRLRALYPEPTPYIAAWHQAPVDAEAAPRLHLELFSIRRSASKLKYLAGSEAAMGAFISDVAPEDAAARLRAVPPNGRA